MPSNWYRSAISTTGGVKSTPIFARKKWPTFPICCKRTNLKTNNSNNKSMPMILGGMDRGIVLESAVPANPTRLNINSWNTILVFTE